MTIPQDLSIEIGEIEGTGGALGQIAGPLKFQTITNDDIHQAIDTAGGTFEETNGFLDLSLSFVNQREIPVEVSVFNFAYTFEKDGKPLEVKFDFGIFDLDGDGVVEACSGCTCPTGCAPALAACPREAPEDQLQPICFRVWVNNERYMAGVFDRVPTLDNPQSGQFRNVFVPSFVDLIGTNMAITYDHRDSQNFSTDLSMFLKDVEAGPDFFSRRHAVTTQEGPEAQSKKTPRLADEFLGKDSRLRFQAEFFSHLDFIALESIPEGIVFVDELGLVPITPPICAQILSSEPVAQVLCDDLELILTPGSFPSLPELSGVVLPPLDQFPESPTF